MTQFSARQIAKSFTHRIDAEPDKVFPLLCPVREYDWIKGWECRMIHSGIRGGGKQLCF